MFQIEAALATRQKKMSLGGFIVATARSVSVKSVFRSRCKDIKEDCTSSSKEDMVKTSKRMAQDLDRSEAKKSFQTCSANAGKLTNLNARASSQEEPLKQCKIYEDKTGQDKRNTTVSRQYRTVILASNSQDGFAWHRGQPERFDTRMQDDTWM